MKLIIVGNGFDLAHKNKINAQNKFDTLYLGFVQYLKNKKSDFLTLLQILSLGYDINKDNYWYKFEERLGNPNFVMCISANLGHLSRRL